MKASELRASLLQEAVSGRLVPQIDGEGSAADLLKEIEAERAALVAAGKLKKEKPLPAITEEEKPFEIPESWEWVRLGDLCSKIHYGYTASANISGNAKILRITDIQNNSVDWNSLPYCTVSSDEMTRYNLNNHDILFARTGGTVGKTYLVKDLNKNESIVFASYLIRAVPSPLVNETYLKRFMESPLYWGQIADQAKGTGQDNVNGEKLKRMMFPLPPLSEQRRIVSKLDELLPLVDAYEKEEEALSKLNAAFPERMRKSILQEAVSGKLVPQLAEEGTAADLLKEIAAEKKELVAAGKMKKEKPLPEISEEEKPFEIPESWEWVRLLSICTKFVDGSHFPPPAVPSGYPVISAKNIQDRKIVFNVNDRYASESDFFKENERTNISSGDIILAIVGSVGKVAIYSDSKKIIAQRSVAILDTLIDNLFLSYVFESPYCQNVFTTNANGTAQKGIYLNTLSQILLPIPPLSEQRRIVKKIEEVMQIIGKMGGEIQVINPIISDIINCTKFGGK